MAIIDLALADFGQTVGLLKNTKTSLMSGEINIEDLSSITPTNIEAVVVKKNVSDSQEREGRLSSQNGYMLVKSNIDITEDDVIITQNEYFFIYEVTLKHDNITGDVGSEPTYKRCELEIYQYL